MLFSRKEMFSILLHLYYRALGKKKVKEKPKLTGVQFLRMLDKSIS